jgi:molybdopterin/thiamine biosynthesis adenylyltransferase
MTKKIDVKHSRFRSTLWYDPNYTVIIGGVGGIGSWLSLFLARMGYQIHVFDYDSIDETNMAGQLYPVSAIGDSKAETIQKICKEFAGNDIFINEKYTEESPSNPIIFSAFDCIDARRLMFNKWRALKDREVFIDGRMLIESGQVFCVTPGKEDEYEKHLFKKGEVKPQQCSLKATSHSGAIIAGLMVTAFTNYLTNKKVKADVRELPFKFDYELPLFNFKEDTCNTI